VNQEQREYLSEVIDCLLNPVSPEDPRGSVWLSSTDAKRLGESMQSMLDEIDAKPEAITLRDQFAVAISGGLMTNGGYKSSVLEQVYKWADIAMKGRDQ
jgi:hypothetical protein